MPRVVRAFACEFGCHRNVTTSRKSMEKHETRCFHNPNQKACATCKHLTTDYEEEYMGHQFGDAVFGQPHKVRYCEKEIDLSERLQSNCPQWERNEQQQEKR